ncbi:uncharacterized protein B0H18DRAFT_1022078, partial [Fomitopsis serialis]|uniref:uncharacterized protein n=1 Tax=Fomitopsis serialis TaxID=139415 RepID=UPI0020071EED
MSKHRDQFAHDQFKTHAKELTHIIVEKEKRSASYREGRLDALSDEKAGKIKKFAKEYIAKILRKADKKRRESGGGGAGPASASPSSPSMLSPSVSGEGADLAAAVADVMDLDGPDDADENMEMDMDASPLADSETPPSDAGGTPAQTPPALVGDPRLRHRREECGWDPDGEKMAGRVRPVVVSAVSV